MMDVAICVKPYSQKWKHLENTRNSSLPQGEELNQMFRGDGGGELKKWDHGSNILRPGVHVEGFGVYGKPLWVQVEKML